MNLYQCQVYNHLFLHVMCESAKRATVAGSFAEDCRKTLHEKVGKAMNADEQTPR